MCKATYFEHDQRLAFYTNSEPILYEPRKSRKSRKFRRGESLTISIDDNDLDSYRLIASLQETQLEIRDRGAEKWWAKKWKTWGSWLFFSAHHFFATSNALPTSRSTSICRSTLTRFRAIRTSWSIGFRMPERHPSPSPNQPRIHFRNLASRASVHGIVTACLGACVIDWCVKFGSKWGMFK